MGSYLSDWKEAEDQWAAVRARFPDCTMQFDCPAEEHPVDCRRAHREWRLRNPL